MLTVFFDGKCGMCNREINFYRRIAKKGAFKWQDVTDSSMNFDNEQFSLEQSLKLFHVKDKDNKLFVGVDAFLIIWSKIPFFKWLAKLGSLPVIYPILNKAYHAFAKWRFGRITYCKH